jgi:hypothetical protein
METLVSSFLGRPAATVHPLRERATANFSNPAATTRGQAVESIYELMEITDDVLVNVDWQTSSNPASAKAIIGRLTQWSTSLPQDFFAASDQTISVACRQELILANLQVMCSYYYAVIMATRPYLAFQSLQNQAIKKDTTELDSDARETPAPSVVIDSDPALLSKSCEDAAVFMISTCHDALKEGALLDNMCLLQSV